jgi:3-oxoacyl-[acyl-carrier-protein] synthase II
VTWEAQYDEACRRHGSGNGDAARCGVDATWQRHPQGKSGSRRIEKFDVSDLPCKIAGQIPRGDGTDGTYNPDQWMEPKEQRKVDEFIVYAMCAATQALDDAGWHPNAEDQIATGVLIGSGIGGVEGIASLRAPEEKGPRRISPFFIPGRSSTSHPAMSRSRSVSRVRTSRS